MKNNSSNIDRREAIRRTSLIMGGALSAPLMTGLMQGCTVSNEPTWTPQFMDESQAKLLTNIVNTILPTTDTPGAVEVGVPEFIDRMLNDIYPEEWQTMFREGIAAFDAGATEAYGDSFNDLDKEQQTEYLLKLQEEAMAEESEDPNFYMALKEITVAGYGTSEAGATMVLKYDKVPGAYKGCIDFSEVGKTWAT